MLKMQMKKITAQFYQIMWENMTGQCMIESYLSATMLSTFCFHTLETQSLLLLGHKNTIHMIGCIDHMVP